MKRINQVAMAVVCTLCAQNALAQKDVDTVKVRQLNEVVVKAVRAQKNAPFAVANIEKPELKDFSATGRELPYLFSRTPGIISWSENGIGTGTTYLRMRGAAGSRINVTLDGVALNSPEDQQVFWANMNSYAALLGSVQIQRGVGASTNGDGAFGGSISLATQAPQVKPFAELTGSYGTYNTYNTGASFSTGLLFNHLIFDGAYHETATDGFVDGTRGRSGSYYGGLTWLGDNFQIRYKNIGNFEKTGQAWNYITGPEGTESYKQIYEMGLGRSNTLLGNYDKDENGNYKLTPFTYRDGTPWDRTTDNFYQNHNILSATWQPSEHWTHNAALHYTYGRGYYKDLKVKKSLAEKFGINERNDAGKFIKSDAVRLKGLTQNAYGLVYNVNYKDEEWDVTGGVNLQQFRGSHWGYLTYIKDEALEQKYFDNHGKYKYYDSDARKDDYSAFVKAAYTFLDNWNVFADLQYRHVGYKTDGINDKFVMGSDGNYYAQRLDVDDDFNFFNPKAGVSYTNGGHKAYASVSLANREPERNNYTDNGNYPYPKKEQVTDYELGYQYTGSNWHAGANFYYMAYDNQIAQTGQTSDIGEALTTNIKDSYRMGVELTAGWAPLSWMSVEGNAALSQNKIKDFDEYLGDHVNHYDKSTLAYSPSAILNGFLDFHYQGFNATWHTNFVSKQYVDNSESSERQLPSFSQTDINMSYTINLKGCGLKSVKLGLDLNNIFDRHYAVMGYDWGWYEGDTRKSYLGYVPAAGFTMMGNITLRF